MHAGAHMCMYDRAGFTVYGLTHIKVDMHISHIFRYSAHACTHVSLCTRMAAGVCPHGYYIIEGMPYMCITCVHAIIAVQECLYMAITCMHVHCDNTCEYVQLFTHMSHACITVVQVYLYTPLV